MIFESIYGDQRVTDEPKYKSEATDAQAILFRQFNI